MERFKRRVFPTFRQETILLEKRNDKVQGKSDLFGYILIRALILAFTVSVCQSVEDTYLLYLPMAAAICLGFLIYDLWIRSQVEG